MGRLLAQAAALAGPVLAETQAAVALAWGLVAGLAFEGAVE